MRKNFFMLDNNIFNLKLDAYEFQIYAYLVCCAGRNAESWPSYNTMARMLCMSTNTVIKKIDSLQEKRLIDKVATRTISKNGKTRTSNNHYYLTNFDEALAHSFRFSGGASKI